MDVRVCCKGVLGWTGCKGARVEDWSVRVDWL